MASERLIAFFALGILMTFLAQTKSVEATRRVVIPVGPRIVQCMKKVDELKKQIASLEKSKQIMFGKTQHKNNTVYVEGLGVSKQEEGFLFASSTVTNYVDAGNLSEPLDALTSCVWIKFEDSSRDMECVFSIPSQTEELEFVLLRAYGNLVLATKGRLGQYNVIRFNEWSHFCVTRESGTWRVYINGTLKDTFKKPGVIVGGEKWVYGQCYFTLGESFQSGGAFIGEMAGINVWDRVLRSQEISEISRSCAAKKGNIITMADLNVMGGLRKIIFSC